MKPALLAEILRDPTAVAERCVGLRDALPFANVSRLVARQPELLLQVCISLFTGRYVTLMGCLDIIEQQKA